MILPKKRIRVKATILGMTITVDMGTEFNYDA